MLGGKKSIEKLLVAEIGGRRTCRKGPSLVVNVQFKSLLNEGKIAETFLGAFARRGLEPKRDEKVVLQIFANSGVVIKSRDMLLVQDRFRADARELEELRRLECAGCYKYFSGCVDHVSVATGSESKTCSNKAAVTVLSRLEIDLGYKHFSQDLKIRSICREWVVSVSSIALALASLKVTSVVAAPRPRPHLGSALILRFKFAYVGDQAS